MTAADVVGVDQLADEHVVGIQKAMSLDDTRGYADLLTGSIGIRARQGTESDFGATLDSALMLIPAVKAKHIGIAQVVDALVPMGTEHTVDVTGRRKHGFCREGKDHVTVKALSAEKDSTLISPLCSDQISVLYTPLSCHDLPILLPVGIGVALEQNGTLIKLDQLAEQM